MVNSLEVIKALDELNITCRKERVEAFLELIKIHLESCDKCSLRIGVKKVD